MLLKYLKGGKNNARNKAQPKEQSDNDYWLGQKYYTNITDSISYKS